LTEGNAFYVTEILAVGGDAVLLLRSLAVARDAGSVFHTPRR